MRTRTAILVNLLILLGMFIYALVVHRWLPDRVPSHWNIDGEVDGWMSPWATHLFGFGMALLMFGLLVGGRWISPRGYDPFRFLTTWNYIMTLAVGLMAYLYVMMTQAALRPDFDAGRWIVIGILALFALMGNVIGRTRPNFWMGIRTPWTLTNEQVWLKTHRLGGRLMVGCALLGIAILMLGGAERWAFALILVAAFFPVLYSFVVYKLQEPA